MQPLLALRQTLFLALVTLLIGCSNAPTVTPGTIKLESGFGGAVHGGQQPISGASVQLYAASTAKDGGAAVPLLPSPILTQSDGSFSFTSYNGCPSSSSLLYYVATGGNPGLAAGTNNTAIAAMAVVGPCANLNQYVNLNEVTTVAATAALYPFMTGPANVGAGVNDLSTLAPAFTLAAQLANSSTGTSPGTNVPNGASVPTAQINSLANAVATCVNSAGATTSGSACGTLFADTTPANFAAPTNTLLALLYLAKNPSLNTASIFAIPTPSAPFQPTLAQVPADYSVNLNDSASTATPTFSTSSLSFPSTSVGFAATPMTLTLTNNGTAYAYAFPTLSGSNSGDFSLTLTSGVGDCTQVINPGASCTYSVGFTPTAAGTRTAYLILREGSGTPESTVSLSGNATAAAANGPLTYTALPFIPAGSSATTTLTNSGTTSISINGISIVYNIQNGQTFSQTNNCGTMLYAQSICTITVSASTGTFSAANLVISDGYAPGSQTLPINTLYSSSRAIGTVTTYGPTSYSGYFYDQSGPPSSPPWSTSTPTNCVSAHGYNYCAVSVYYKPTALGLSTYSIPNADGSQPFTYTGYGIPAGAFFSTNVTSVNLPGIYLGQSWSTLSNSGANLVVTNNGSSSLNLAGSLTGADTNAFSFTLPSSGGYTPITFTAQHLGGHSATLTITDLISKATLSVLLTGFGAAPLPTVSPTSLTFASTTVGTTSTPSSVSVNDYYNNPAYAVVQSGPFAVSSSNTCASLPCQFSFTFTPTSVGTVYGSAYIYSNHQYTSINLQGTGTGVPVVTLSPTSITFASRPVGSTSIAVSATIMNSGSGPLTLSGISLAGAKPGDYILGSNTCSASIPAGSSCSYSVSFAPSASGSRTASVQITSNASSSPDIVTLTGTAQ